MKTKVVTIKFIHYYGNPRQSFLYPKDYNFRLNEYLAKKIKIGDIIHLPDNHGKRTLAKVIAISMVPSEVAQQYHDLTLLNDSDNKQKVVKDKPTIINKKNHAVNKTTNDTSKNNKTTNNTSKKKVKILIKNLRKGVSIKKD